MPPRVVDPHVSRAFARQDGESGDIGQDAISHERAHTHRAVVRAGDGVANPRVDAPERQAVRQRHAALQLRRLAEERHEAPGLAARRRHLVHHAARGADDEVLDLLAQDRAIARID
jgi:hypothetical protein